MYKVCNDNERWEKDWKNLLSKSESKRYHGKDKQLGKQIMVTS